MLLEHAGIMISLSFQDVNLLKQFICPHTGQILEPKRTGMCLVVAASLTSVVHTHVHAICCIIYGRPIVPFPN